VRIPVDSVKKQKPRWRGAFTECPVSEATGGTKLSREVLPPGQ
jgi:hypothetical protein